MAHRVNLQKSNRQINGATFRFIPVAKTNPTLIVTQYRVNARAFPSQLAAKIAIAEHRPQNPDAFYENRHYVDDGWYVLVTTPGEEGRWLTRGTIQRGPQ